MDKVDKLYECYDVLANAGEDIKNHEAEYRTILEAVKGEPQEKMLASQFIPRFFKHFLHLADTALDAELDLIEEEDIAIRKQAIKHLPSFCKDHTIYVSKIADILAQMLVCEDASELAIVNSSLATVLKLDVKAALAGIFSQVKTADEDIVRKRAITFICNKVKFLPPDMVTKDIEEYILQEAKAAVKTVSSDEFSSLMSMLANLKAAKTLQGQQALIEIIMGQVELDKEFNPESAEETACLVHCIRSALPFFSHFVSSSPFVKYICQQILPVLKKLANVDEVEMSLEVVRLLAEIAPFYNELEDVDACLEKVHEALLEFVPLPPAEGLEDGTLAKEPNFQFTHIECLMYALHQLAKKKSDFLTHEDNAARFKDFKLRLNFLARSIQGCMKTIKESLSNEKDKAAKPEEHKLKAVALRTMSNINSLIKDIFHIPPSFKTTIVLSWKPATGRRLSDTTAVKRKDPPAADENAKESKKDWKGSRQLYTPPGGKYSSNVKKFYPSAPGYYRGRGRGRFY